MTRFILSACCLITVVGATAWADDDVVRVKLDAAKLAYEQEMLKYRRVVHDWIDKREEVARMDGNKKAVDLIKAERTAFDEKNELPRTSPDEFRQNFLKARAILEAAYNLAIKEYVQVKKDYEATVVEKELARLKSSPITVIPTPTTANGIPVITPEMLRAKLAGKATYDAKTGVLTVSYKFADKKELEDFDCEGVKPKLAAGGFKLEPGESVRHVVQFDTLALSVVVQVHVMKGRVLSTSNGTVVTVGGSQPDTVYLDTRGVNGAVWQVLPASVRNGFVRVEMNCDEKKAILHWGKERIGRDVKAPSAGWVQFYGGDAGFGFGALTISGTVNPKWAGKFFGLTAEGEKLGAIEKSLLGKWRIQCPDGYKAEWTFKVDGSVSVTKGPPQSGNWEIDLKKEQVLCLWKSGLIDRFDFPIVPKLTTGGGVGRNITLEAIKVP
ncbi:MAG TPA: hypothetical protein VKS79_01320 [Gemmataceae bacterium]|nr:hypothetical protein [Gemmataceae bacterium]